MHLFWFLALVCAAQGAPFPSHDQSPCPSECECLTLDMVTTTRCSSLAFINDAPSETLNKVSHLDLRHSNLTVIIPLRKLHGLKNVNLAHNDVRHLVDLSSLTKLSSLNLRGNQLKNIDLVDLPKNLEHLDVSANHLAEFPNFEHVRAGKHGKGRKLKLREVNLAENPFTCSCELKTKCDDLQKWVVIVKPVTCRDGSGNIKEVSGLDCPVVKEDGHHQHNDLERMQNDEQIDGSGDEPEPAHEEEEEEEDQTDIFAENQSGEHKMEMQKEELLPTATSSVAPELTDEDYVDNGEDQDADDEEEGSGHSGDAPADNEDEGSGDPVLIFPTTEETPLKACNFDCSTPLTMDETTNSTLPDPSLIDEISKGVKGLWPWGDDEDDDEEEDFDSSSNETVIEAPIVPLFVDKSGSGRSGDGVVPVLINEEDKMHSAEGSEASEVKEAGNPLGLSNNMIVVIALIIVMACIIVYSILTKRRKNARRSPRSSHPREQEMKEIKPTKPARQSLSPSDKNKGSLPEKVPLINGQNGSGQPGQNGGAAPKNGSASAPDASTPLINEPPLQKDDYPVQMRSPQGDHSPLLPETHKVTVQAKELTAPKTPLLVSRVRSQDGQIITTPETNQRY